MLDQLELVGEATSKNEVVLTVLVVATDLLNDQSLIVFINGDPTNDSVNLGAL